MFPLTFQTEHVADMSEDTTRLVANFVARNMDRVPSTSADRHSESPVYSITQYVC